MNNYLILRSQNSPYNDVTKSSVLSFADMDNNLIFLKGNLIYTATTDNGIVTLKKYNGEDISFAAGSGGGGSDTYWTSGTTGVHSIRANNETMTNAYGDYSVSEGLNTAAIGTGSHAEGGDTQAIGDYSHAEGESTIASGTTSHAEGIGTQALGEHSHTEGAGTIASGSAAHAEGMQTIATFDAAHAEGHGTQAINYTTHAEGFQTIASGDTSHAEGDSTQANGPVSHAEGYSTEANGLFSHAEGAGTIAAEVGSHAEGLQTIAGGPYSHSEGYATTAISNASHVEGRETKAGFRAFEIVSIIGNTLEINTYNVNLSSNFQSGVVFTSLNGNIVSYTYNPSLNDFDNGYTYVTLDSTPSGIDLFVADSLDLNNSLAVLVFGHQSHAENYGTFALGENSHAEGYGVFARGESSHAGGFSDNGAVNYLVAGGKASFSHFYLSSAPLYGFGDYGALANYSTVLGGQDHYLSPTSESSTIIGGFSNVVYNTNVNSGIFAGNANLAIDSNNSTIIGGDANGLVRADDSVVAGGYNNLIDGFHYNGPAYGFIGGGLNNKIQTGGGPTAEASAIIGGDSNTIKHNNQYNGIYNSYNSILDGQDTSTILGGYNSVIIDYNNGLQAHNNAIINAGDSSINTFGGSHANIMGGSNNSINQNVDGVNQPNFTSILNGYGNQIYDSDTAVIFNGFQNLITANSKQSSIINGQNQSITSSQFSAILGGNDNEMTDSDGSALIGGSGNRILSDGNPAFTRYYNAILGGTGNTINNSELSFIMGGYQNVIPYGTVGSVILGGDSITATTNNTVFVQRLNIKYAQNDNLTTKLLTIDSNGLIKYRDVSSISGGTGGSGGTTVDLYWASGTTGTNSLKRNNGSTTDATANYALAEGFNTLASGIYSHAEGNATESRAQSSHAQNEGTLAKGNYSHAGGYNSTASGSTSFVHSYQSTAFGDRTVVLGGSNIAGNNSDTVYVPYLNIQSATTDNTLTSFLVKNGDGSIKTRQLASLYSAVTSMYVGSLTASTYYNLPVDTLSQVLASGNTTGANNIIVNNGNGLRTADNSSILTLNNTFIQLTSDDLANNIGSINVEGGDVVTFSQDATGIYTEIATSAAGSGGNSLTVSSGANSTLLFQNDKKIEVTNSNSLTPGIQYAADYSINFKNNTLVTRKFVESGMSGLTVNGSLSATTYLGLPKDIRVTGGTYNAGTTTFTNNTGGTFNVTGYYTGTSSSDTYVTGFTYSNNVLTVKQNQGQADLTATINTMTGLTVNGNFTYTGQSNNPVYVAGTVTSTHIPNWNNSNIQTVTLSAATTNISGGTNIANGAVYTMILKQNATGSRVVNWASQYKWQSGIAPVLTSTANGVDILTFISDGTNLYGLIAKDFR